ncbi:replicative DNA helicase [[Clostridium] ultunense Esp]|nr:replicative DNA helicase [[Clostridium] ultunense Esp]
MSDLFLDRTPPHQVEAEQAVLGSIFLEPEALITASGLLNPTDFYLAQHQKIYEAMLALGEEGEPVDIISVTTRLKERGLLEEIGGIEYLSDLSASVPTAANVEYYAKVVAEKALLRRLIRTASEIAASSYAGVDPVERILSDAEKAIFDLSQKQVQTGFVKIADILMETYSHLERISKSHGEITGVPTGYHDLDRLTSGFQRSDFIVVAARPSVGKTAFALNVAQNVAVRSRRPVAIFSLEMSAAQLAMRMLAAEANIDAGKLRTGRLSEEEWEKLIMGMGMLADSPIFIDDTPGITVTEIRSRLRRLVAEQGDLGMVMIDYLQLITGRSRASDNRQQEISEISRHLKGTARELNVPVIALSQLSRAVEQRQDKHPMLSDIRESGSIEQDADIVAFLYRDDYYNPETEEKNIIEVIVAKQRNGPTGKVKLAFLKEYNKFVNIAKPYQETGS